ncbi:VOC family protein [Achromobacter arsenitoxydans]|uniref:Glyoxalase/bleomycin resistance protein/dioxygenase superfamily protein 21 n=1 Tax=Achromobacter arsenitoxydans SY8 TaxID=477184 RepID=H0F7D6_9BURK|nr:VOC family protein [Achromobacter arsenitoxydans]EHK65853.1 glyoxalase/bleomycin resistance protein/dioxygenase superfamily protein 21 [Achromobacter arsenitoxydans SY8]
MQLLDHVSITVSRLDAARPFYDAVMRALGADKVYDRPDALGYGERCRPGSDAHTYLSVFATIGAPPDAASGARRHWCFKAPSRAAVDAFHAAGLAHGGRDEGAPGLRPDYHPQYYAAFLLDPEGNRVEAVCHGPG